MDAPETEDLIERFARFIEGVREHVCAETQSGNWIPLPLLFLLSERLKRIGRRFARLVAQFRAGTLPEVRVRAVPASPRPTSAPVMVRLNRTALLSMVQGASVWRGVLMGMLDDPEMAVVIAGVPQLGRELRPLCGMLGITPPVGLALPARPRRVRAARSKKLRVPRVERTGRYWHGPGFIRREWDADWQMPVVDDPLMESEPVTQKRAA